MKYTFRYALLLFIITTTFFCSPQKAPYTIDENRLVQYTVNPKTADLHFFWKNKKGKHYKSLGNLKQQLKTENKTLLFAMNGGMYLKDLSPQGLYIENGKTIRPVNRKKEGYGNFYLQPNGVFYLNKENTPAICKTGDFKNNKNIKYATQSGPMLLIDGKIHPKLNKGSKNLHIRNGVGILPNGDLLFAMSKKRINFYDFATFFKQNGCKNALYLDGFVSRTYAPNQNWKQLDGHFGVIIGVVEN